MARARTTHSRRAAACGTVVASWGCSTATSTLLRSAECGRCGRLGRVVLDAPVAHLHDAIGGAGDVVVVGDEHDRLSIGVEASEELEDLLPAGGVEGASR